MPQQLRIYHYINIDSSKVPFHFEVPDVATAIRALSALALYDLFLGEGESYEALTTVGARREKRRKLAGRDHLLSKMFREYDAYQLQQCPGGVPIVTSNVQGCETLEDGEWIEFYDEEGCDIRELAET